MTVNEVIMEQPSWEAVVAWLPIERIIAKVL